ncbi:MAG: radical SAM protein [Rhodospirillaceae bacterium]
MNTSPLTIGLVQINNSFSGQNYLPYSVACLQAYAQAYSVNPQRLRFLEPIYKRTPINQIVEHLKTADVVGFSTYVWNIRISLEVARRLKELRPNICIVFGGPQVPDRSELFLRTNRQVDIAFHGESEVNFLRFLEAYPGGGWGDVSGTSHIAANGNFIHHKNTERLRDLSLMPSPFLTGLFDDLMANNPAESWIGLWETNRGCPFSCSYCDWGSATATKVTKFGLDRLLDELDWFSEKKIGYVFVCDANFGMLPRDVDVARRVAANRARTGFPEGFSVQNTKNATDRAYAVQKILADAGLNKGVALSIQTLSKEALVNIRRDNISLETYLELQRRFAHDKVETYSDIIIGLPGETYESFVMGIDQLLESGQHSRIQFNNCTILPNAQMGDPEYLERMNIKFVENHIVNIHGSKEILDDDVPEFQETIISTYSLSKADWARSRAFSWMCALLHFDKILQIPLILVRNHCGLSYRYMFDSFMEADRTIYPLLGEIRDFFLSTAADIQVGAPEYLYDPDWLGIYWPADEYVFIKMTAAKTLDTFYGEAHALLADLITKSGATEEALDALSDAIRLNSALLHQPFVFTDMEIELNFNIFQFYQGVIQGDSIDLMRKPNRLFINRTSRSYSDFQVWCREIVWWGNKKGAYLYTNNSVNAELSGHY